MNTSKPFQTVAWIVSLLTAGPALGLPAFPGAQGFGSETPGGRGGRVIAVTTLADSGPGSLREAVTASGPRTIVFRVGGEIRLKSHLIVTEPFVTIAGQTAPGDGILLRDAGFYIQTHDVVVRFIRCRVGASLADKPGGLDGLHVGGENVYNVVVNHCSFSWGVDECASIRRPARDVTLSWNIISEGLRRPFTEEQIGEDRSHSMAVLLSGGPDRCTLHHNLLALCNSRNPRIQGGRHAFVNNVVYGWGSITGMFSREPEVNFIGNYYKPGPYSRRIKPISEHLEDMGKIYVQGNISPFRPDNTLPEWDLTVNAPADKHQAEAPFDMAPLHISGAEHAYGRVLAVAGASLPVRDTVDERIVRSVHLSLGRIIDRPEEVGGFPILEGGEPPADSDGDGMPDGWELAQGFDPNDPSDGPADVDGDGYTNLEEYLNELVYEGLRPRPEILSMLVEQADAASMPVELTANDMALPVASVAGRNQILYAHAWIHGAVPITLRAPFSTTPPTMLTRRYDEPVSAQPGSLTFAARSAGPRVIEFGAGGETGRLFLFLDPYPRRTELPEGVPVFDARDFGITYGRTDITLRLRTALEACAKAGGGIVYIPTGEHEITSVRIPAGVTLYLDRTAVLYSIGDPEGAPPVLIEGVAGAGLSGPGTIDGRAGAGVRRTPLVVARNARDLRIQNLIIRDPAGPGLLLENCQDVTVTGTKILASTHRPELGGLSIDGGRHIVITRSFISSSGHGLSMQSSSPETPLEDVSVAETVIHAERIAIMVGPENQASIRNIRMEAVDVTRGTHGINVMQKPGAGMSDLAFRNMNLHLIAPPDNISSGIPLYLTTFAADAATTIRNVTLEAIETNAYRTSTISSRGPAMLENLGLYNIQVRAEGQRPTVGADIRKEPLFHLLRVRDAIVRGLHVAWPENRDRLWSELVDADGCENLDYQGNGELTTFVPEAAQPKGN